MNHQLRADLDAAAKGHAVTCGEAAPNLFARALDELKRLEAIETDVKTLFSFSDPKTDSRALNSWERNTNQAITERMTVAKRLGEAVGGLPKCFVPRAVA